MWDNILYMASKWLSIAGVVFMAGLVVAIIIKPEWMQFLFIATMVCFAAATIIALINVFISNNND